MPLDTSLPATRQCYFCSNYSDFPFHIPTSCIDFINCFQSPFNFSQPIFLLPLLYLSSASAFLIFHGYLLLFLHHLHCPINLYALFFIFFLLCSFLFIYFIYFYYFMLFFVMLFFLFLCSFFIYLFILFYFLFTSLCSFFIGLLWLYHFMSHAPCPPSYYIFCFVFVCFCPQCDL